MADGVQPLSVDVTHKLWCEQLNNQHDFLHGVPQHIICSTAADAEQKLSQSRSRIGTGRYDAPYESQDIVTCLNKWDTSQACPADLCPRAAFTQRCEIICFKGFDIFLFCFLVFL